MTAPGRLYTIREVAAAAGVCERTVRRWIKAGLLPARRLGGSSRIIRIHERDLRAFLEEA